MKLIVSGMALSFQWWPSITHFEDSLGARRAPSPAMVEQAGEVIYQAISETQYPEDTRMSIMYDPGKLDLGHYLDLFEDEFISVDELIPASSSLISRINQVADLIENDSSLIVVICEILPTGSAAIVLSSAALLDQISSRISISDLPDQELSQSDYVLIGQEVSNLSGTSALLQDLFRKRKNQFPVALGRSEAAHSLSSDLVTLIQAVLSLKNKSIPASDSDLEQITDQLPGSAFYTSKAYRPWLSRGASFSRSALILLQGQQEDRPAYLQLKENATSNMIPSIRIVDDLDPYLFPISGNNSSNILKKLESLEYLITGQKSIRTLSNTAYTQYYSPQEGHTLVLLAKDRGQLMKEISHAKIGFEKAYLSGEDWKSPNGSYFSPKPLGADGVTFVYPGAFNSHPGMGRGLFFSFPTLQEEASQIIPNLSHSLAEEYLYLRPSRPGPESDPDQIMSDFYQHPNQLIESGISLSVLHTIILDQFFGIKPTAAFGYSLGEVSMLWANGVWRNAQDRSEIWDRSSLFKDELFGEMKAVRRFWNDKDLAEDFWASYILKTDHDLAEKICAQEEMVFVSIINTYDEVVIVGEKDACQRVISDLGCRALPMPFNAVIHNPTMQSTYPSFVDLYRIPTVPNPGIKFYSASGYEKLILQETILADEMAKMTCNPVDFPRLVNQIYEDGARIFLEVGPQKTCSRWIEKILKGKPHAAISINKRYQEDLHGILKVIALLLSHRVKVDLSHLFEIEETPDSPAQYLREKPSKEKKSQEFPSARSSSDRSPEKMSRSFFENMEQISQGMARSHQFFLENQQTLTRNLARIMQIQADSPPDESFSRKKIEPLYSKRQIQAFTRGDHRLCFGTTFSGFGDRRIPRLPNGELQFIDRVMQIDGQAEQVQEGSSLISEFDLPPQAWYKNGSYKSLPYVTILEMALQPCGFLSAYMGSIKGRESQDHYFRNLDGEGTLISWPSIPSKTITNHVRLLSSSSLEDVIIQNYGFELSWGGEVFYRGSSSFGYFPQPMLLNQTGLDAGGAKNPWYQDHPGSGTWHRFPSSPRRSNSHQEAGLPELSEIWISPTGGKSSSGYVYSRQDLHADDWFYKAHFYQDPVMPGSLGVESMAQALISSAPVLNLSDHFKWRLKTGHKTHWKYRGQITPETREYEIELHLKNINLTGDGAEIQADGILWKNSKPIYLVENIALETY